MTTPKPPVPLSKQIDVPPVWLALSIGAIALLDRLIPLVQVVPSTLSPLGWVLIAAGLGLIAWTARAFFAARTPIHPRRKPTELLTTGPFAFSRNPIYLGMAAIAAGVWVLHGSLGALLPVVGFVWIVQTRFIAGEEFYIDKNYGDAWREYVKRVRRWI